jgi:hypothetical protein
MTGLLLQETQNLQIYLEQDRDNSITHLINGIPANTFNKILAVKVELSCPSGCPESKCSTTVRIHLDSDTHFCSNCLTLLPNEQQLGWMDTFRTETPLSSTRIQPK